MDYLLMVKGRKSIRRRRRMKKEERRKKKEERRKKIETMGGEERASQIKNLRNKGSLRRRSRDKSLGIEGSDLS